MDVYTVALNEGIGGMRAKLIRTAGVLLAGVLLFSNAYIYDAQGGIEATGGSGGVFSRNSVKQASNDAASAVSESVTPDVSAGVMSAFLTCYTDDNDDIVTPSCEGDRLSAGASCLLADCMADAATVAGVSSRDYLLVATAADGTDGTYDGDVVRADGYQTVDGAEVLTDGNATTVASESDGAVLNADEAGDANAATASVYGYTNIGIACVDEGNLNVRSGASADSGIVGKMTDGAACDVIGVDGEWTQISSGEVEGYVKSEYLLTGDAAVERANELIRTVATVTATTLYVREEPNTDCTIMTSMPKGEELDVIEVLDGWVKVEVDSDEGYVSADYVEVGEKLDTAHTLSELRYGAGVSDTRVALVEYALQFVGNPYVYGGTSLTKGADCSGFVMSVFAHFGISLPHSSKSQANYGTSISASQAQPGDLFFYGSGKSISHVAIYIGNGQVVHASSAKTGIKISSAYYRTPIKVVRILSN